MNEVERWLRRQAEREQRGVLLEEGLLGDRLWAYTRYRLRYFFLKYVVETAVHAVTVLFLLRELRFGRVLPIIVAHSVVSFATSFWWGALEAMREQVRDLHRSGKPHRISRAIGGWLTLAGLGSAAVLAVTFAWIGWHGVRGSLGAPEAYVATVLLRLAVELPTRCLHSGIFALRRVYKPLWAILGPELLGLVVILALSPSIGLWALVVSAVLMTAVLTAINVRFTGRVYHFTGLAPWRELGTRVMRASLRGMRGLALRAGSANTIIALDSLVVLALLYGAARDTRALIVLFLAGPGIRAGADWARLYYFDLKRLELRLFANVRRRFERHTAQVAWLLGLVFWTLTSALAALFYGTAFAYAALLVFFLARSMLARVQLQAFAEGAYAAILGTGVALLAGLASAAAFVDDDGTRLAAVAVVTGASAAVLTVLRRRTRARGDPGMALLTLEWLRRLGTVEHAVRVGSARIRFATGAERTDVRTREERTRWRLGQLADHAARRLGEHGAAAWIGPDRLVWFEPLGRPPCITPQWLQVASGGLIGEVTERSCPNGEEALLAAGQGEMLGPASRHLLTPILPVDVAATRRAFFDLLGGGAVYAPGERVPASFAALPGAELRAILVDAVAFARDLRVVRRRSRFDVTALCAGGELRVVFVADAHARRSVRANWHREVTRRNLHAAVGGARRVPAVGRRWPSRTRESERAAMLRNVQLLSELPPKELERVASAMTEQRFPAGARISTEGEPGVGFYVIGDGEASVTVRGVEVARVGPGDHFGEIALVAETPRHATVIAITDLRCYRMVSWEFRSLIERNASISWMVLRSTAKLLDEARRARDAHSEREPPAAS